MKYEDYRQNGGSGDEIMRPTFKRDPMFIIAIIAIVAFGAYMIYSIFAK